MANIGLGLAALGRPGYINLGHAEDLAGSYAIGAMRNNAHAVLDAAWQSGVRYFDVARSYGRAEEFLSSWIKQRKIAPDEIEVGSKWGYTYTAAWQVQTPDGIAHEIKSHQLPVLRSHYLTTMKNLGEHLTLLQIHSATPESGVLENAEILEQLNRVRSSGIQIGLSVTGVSQPDTIDQALAIEFDGARLFSSVQATWNLLEQSAGPALKRASAAGLKVIIKEGLANGRLTRRNEASEFAEKLTLVRQIASELNTTMDAFSLAACLNQPWATTVLSGAATVEHLQSNLLARDLPWNPELETRLSPLLESPDTYWATRSALPWN